MHLRHECILSGQGDVGEASRRLCSLKTKYGIPYGSISFLVTAVFWGEHCSL